jgi:hypothetical protein
LTVPETSNTSAAANDNIFNLRMPSSFPLG